MNKWITKSQNSSRELKKKERQHDTLINTKQFRQSTFDRKNLWKRKKLKTREQKDFLQMYITLRMRYIPAGEFIHNTVHDYKDNYFSPKLRKINLRRSWSSHEGQKCRCTPSYAIPPLGWTQRPLSAFLRSLMFNLEVQRENICFCVDFGEVFNT